VELGLVALFFALSGGAVIGSINIKYFNKKSSEAMPQFSELLAAAGLIALLWGQDIVNFYQSMMHG